MKPQPEDIMPPKWADRFLEWYCYPPLFDSISGDLLERFDEYLERYGEKKARRKYWFDVLRFMNRHTLKRKNSKVNNFNSISMFKNYFKVGFRNLLKNKSFTTINVLGLSVSMAVCLIIILIINDQTSYDSFQENLNKTYRFTHERSEGIDLKMATIPQPLARTVNERFAGLEHTVNFHRLNGEVLNEDSDSKAIDVIGYYTDPELFDLFSYKLRLGDPKTALSEPFSIVLKDEIARKFFQDENPVGQPLKLNNQQYTVTGVLEKLPGKTHIRFEVFASNSTLKVYEEKGRLLRGRNNWENSSSTWTYFKLREGYSLAQLTPVLDEIEKEFYNEDSEFLINFDIQAMNDITPGPLYGNQIGDGMPAFFVIGLMVLAGLIIICAAFNYTNLSAARAITRTKEVGVRKVMGAKRGQLTVQFIVESVILSLLSLVLSVAFLSLLIPAFESLQMSTLLNWELKLDGPTYLQFFGFAVLVGIVTGLFPSLYLSSFNAINAMKGALSKKKLSGWALRKTLIVSQFVISIVLIVSSMIVYKQIKFIVDKDYGYTKENIINIDLQGQDYTRLKTELDKLPFVEQTTASSVIPNTGVSNSTNFWIDKKDEDVDINYFSIDENYLDILKLELVAGTNFKTNAESYNRQSLIINEKALGLLGVTDPLEAVGKQVYMESDSTASNIIGVVKDYNYQFVFMDIQPLLFRFEPESYNYAQVKILGYDLTDEMVKIDEVWDEFDPNHELIAKTFQGQQDEFNAFFYDILYIIGLIGILSISIATMGLLGISAFAIQARMKEVSIRKVLGANIKSLVMLLSRSFIIMLVIAIVLGFTLAYLGNGVWLNMFAYRTNFGAEIFIFTGLGLLGIAMLTIGWQVMRASNSNPASTLRDD